MRPPNLMLCLPALFTCSLAAACDGAIADDATIDADGAEAVAVVAGALELENGGLDTTDEAPLFGDGLFASIELTDEERADALRDWLDARLGCGELAATDTGWVVTLTQECVWHGKVWSGTIVIRYTATGGALTVALEGTRAGAEAAWDGDYGWDSVGLTIVSARRELEVDGRVATLTQTNVRWLRGDHAPESGSVTLTGFRGRTWTMAFGRDAQGMLVVTVTTPRGGLRTYTVDANGAVRLTSGA